MTTPALSREQLHAVDVQAALEQVLVSAFEKEYHGSVLLPDERRRLTAITDGLQALTMSRPDDDAALVRLHADARTTPFVTARLMTQRDRIERAARVFGCASIQILEVRSGDPEERSLVVRLAGTPYGILLAPDDAEASA